MTFESEVKKHKAVEWLMNNDPAFAAIINTSRLSSFQTAWVAIEFGNMIQDRVAEVAEKMEVTEQERTEGYPLPKNEREREQRNSVRLRYGLSKK